MLKKAYRGGEASGNFFPKEAQLRLYHNISQLFSLDLFTWYQPYTTEVEESCYIGLESQSKGRILAVPLCVAPDVSALLINASDAPSLPPITPVLEVQAAGKLSCCAYCGKV